MYLRWHFIVAQRLLLLDVPKMCVFVCMNCVYVIKCDIPSVNFTYVFYGAMVRVTHIKMKNHRIINVKRTRHNHKHNTNNSEIRAQYLNER